MVMMDEMVRVAVQYYHTAREKRYAPRNPAPQTKKLINPWTTNQDMKAEARNGWLFGARKRKLRTQYAA